jgi:hypothetical protein
LFTIGEVPQKIRPYDTVPEAPNYATFSIPITSCLLGHNIFLRAIFLNSPKVRNKVSHPYKATGKI